VDVAQGRPPHPRRAPRPQALATLLQDDVKRLQEQLALERKSVNQHEVSERTPVLSAQEYRSGHDHHVPPSSGESENVFLSGAAGGGTVPPPPPLSPY
jgi:hypothetical protein